MGKKNYITKSNKNWNLSRWKNNCPLFTFKIIKNKKFPDFLPLSLSSKYNSGYFAASGTTTIYQGKESNFYIGFFLGLRIDKEEIDEQIYISIYNQETKRFVFGGYLQHGNYHNRTMQLTAEQIHLINSSGITVDIKTKRLPDVSQGPLSLLIEQKNITGLEVTAINAMKELTNNN